MRGGSLLGGIGAAGVGGTLSAAALRSSPPGSRKSASCCKQVKENIAPWFDDSEPNALHSVQISTASFKHRRSKQDR